jgi:hypothetical protein
MSGYSGPKGVLSSLSVVWFAPLMKWQKQYPKLALVWSIPLVQKTYAFIEDLYLWFLALLVAKLGSWAIDSMITDAWLRDSLEVVKGYCLIVFYVALACELLETLGFWKFLQRQYNVFIKGHSNGINTVLAAYTAEAAPSIFKRHDRCHSSRRVVHYFA